MTQGNNLLLIACFLFLWTGTIFDFFRLSGKIPEFKNLPNIIDNGFAILESQICIIHVSMLSLSLSQT